MPKNTIADYSATAASNTDIQGVDIDEGCAPSGINNAIRELMADLADVDAGTVALTSPNLTAFSIGGTSVTATAAELNILDGANITTAELSELGDFAGIFTMPTSDGTSGQVLQTNGSGVLSFVDGGGSSLDGLTTTSITSLGVNANTTATGSNNVFVGNSAGSSVTTGTQNTFVGQSAGSGETTSGGNTVYGSYALRGLNRTGGQNNVSIGANAQNFGVSGDQNVAIGYQCNIYGTTGTGNVMIGRTMMGLTSGSPPSGNYNVVVGEGCANFITTGYENSIVGTDAASSITTGYLNSIFGGSAGYNLSTGNWNTILGYYAGNAITSGGNNTTIGLDAGTSVSPFNITTQSNRVVIGDNSISNAYIAVSWSVTSDERDKTDVAPLPSSLDFVDALNPVTFKWDKRSKYFVKDEEGNIIDRPTPDGTHKEDRPFAGFLAQEVQQVIDDLGYVDDVIVDNEQPELIKIKETALIPVLVKAVQELSAKVKVLEAAAG